MTTSIAPDVDEQQVIAEAFRQWNAGQRDQVLALVRPYADAEQPWAQVLTAWFLHQMGEPRWREAIPYVEKAVRAGYPMSVNYVVPNMMNDPQLRTQVADLVTQAGALGYQYDPIGWAQQAAQQNDTESAARLLTATSPGPLTDPAGWEALVGRASEAEGRIREHERQSHEAQSKVAQLAGDVDQLAGEVTERIKTQTGQLFSLIQAATNRQAESIFEEEAKTLRKEERFLWRVGLVTVSVAAVISVAPLAIHYLGFGPDLTSTNVLTAHFTSAASFAVVAGVMLARARGRDRARQRARDLTLALSTMFAYAAQIQDPQERAKFTYDMGRVVIESFLRGDGPGEAGDGSTSIISALLSRAS